jgi:hypothetical protein
MILAREACEGTVATNIPFDLERGLAKSISAPDHWTARFA